MAKVLLILFALWAVADEVVSSQAEPPLLIDPAP